MCFFNGVPVYLCVSVCVASVRRFERICGHTRSLGKRTAARAPGSHLNLSEKWQYEDGIWGIKPGSFTKVMLLHLCWRLNQIWATIKRRSRWSFAKMVGVLSCFTLVMIIGAHRSFTGTVWVLSCPDWDEPNGHCGLLEHLWYIYQLSDCRIDIWWAAEIRRRTHPPLQKKFP